MPTIDIIGPYRFFFYSGDRDEPVHVHVERDENVAKFWLNPIRLQSSGGFTRAELTRIERLLREHHQQFTEAWNEYFNS